MNNCSLSWASYCSLASDFQPNRETAMRCFSEFFVIFKFFIRFESSNVSALKGALLFYNVR